MTVSTDITGEPILILGLADMKILHGLLDLPSTPEQDKVVNRVLQFINDPACLEWELRKNDED